MNINDVLNKLNISYEEIEHDAVYTVEEALSLKEKIDGLGCKNLFLTDKKNGYYLYVLKDDKRADLKDLTKFFGVSRLTFANGDELNKLLGLEKGSVTPLGIINDIDRQVKIIIDKDIVGKRILVHPNVNTKTISIEYEDLIKFIEYNGNEYFVH